MDPALQSEESNTHYCLLTMQLIQVCLLINIGVLTDISTTVFAIEAVALVLILIDLMLFLNL